MTFIRLQGRFHTEHNCRGGASGRECMSAPNPSRSCAMIKDASLILLFGKMADLVRLPRRLSFDLGCLASYQHAGWCCQPVVLQNPAASRRRIQPTPLRRTVADSVSQYVFAVLAEVSEIGCTAGVVTALVRCGVYAVRSRRRVCILQCTTYLFLTSVIIKPVQS